jgi:hypothetical protein
MKSRVANALHIVPSRVGEKREAMDSFMGFAEVGTAIIASMGLAMWMEWYCLRWLLRVMPGQAGASQGRAAEMNESEEAEFAVIEPDLAEAELVAAAPARATRQEIRLGI